MDPVTIGLLVGAGKGLLVDAPKEKRQRMLAAQTALYSPWTGMAPQNVQEADTFGSALQGVTAGAMYNQMGQQNELAQQDLAMKKEYYNSLKPQAAAPTTTALGASPAQGPTMLSPEMQEFMRRKQSYNWANS